MKPRKTEFRLTRNELVAEVACGRLEILAKKYWRIPVAAEVFA